MAISATDQSYRRWRDAVDEGLGKIYCITIADAGLDEEYLVSRWRADEEPSDFVRWLGNKYDLDPIPPFVQENAQGT
jgi:hypothetical protein